MSPAPITSSGDEPAGRVPRARRIGTPALACLIFFTVSGGAYGLEPLVAAVGPGWAVILIVMIPLFWGVPVALMVAELASALPEDGGYYAWVRRGLGDFWGVQEGWWTIAYTAVDMAIYPVLFVDYLAYFWPTLALGPDGVTATGTLALRWLVAAVLILAALALNRRGGRSVGRSAAVGLALVLVPFVLLTIVGLLRPGAAAALTATLTRGFAGGAGVGSLALGLAVVMWNYCGWDNVSTYAAEVDDPRRGYPRALAIALPLIVAAYLLPVLAGLAATPRRADWGESAGWPVIARAVGGPWLGGAVAAAALVSAWTLFNAQLLYASRLPYAMTRDGWLPSALSRTSPSTGVPTAALAASCGVAALFASLPFGKLVVVDILLYAAALSLEFVALIALRIREPGLPRPFRVPGGAVGLGLVTIAPAAVAVALVAAVLGGEEGWVWQVGVVLALVAAGPLLYLMRRSHARETREVARPSH